MHSRTAVTTTRTETVKVSSKFNFIYIVAALIPFILFVVGLSTPRWFYLPLLGTGIGMGFAGPGMMMNPWMFGAAMASPFMGLGMGGMFTFVEIGLFYMCTSNGVSTYGVCIPLTDNNPGFMRCVGWCDRLQAAQALGIISGIFMLFSVVIGGVMIGKDSKALRISAGVTMIIAGIFGLAASCIMIDIRNRELQFMGGLAMMGFVNPWWIGYSLGLALAGSILAFLVAPIAFVLPSMNKMIVTKQQSRREQRRKRAPLIESVSDSLSESDDQAEEVIITDKRVKTVRPAHV